ncbi:hypothetical protein MUU53_19960 [Rhizobium lemnae]|uniref:Uncharacterized protein n=1 Tax=Rhizobium lemnae TaxID=1214924 RepID=A0ABV8EE94_9HYPH|nr:hypothetical protein [Rhizobium lemnae]MCJ8510171.1 hypothetical protein [Rhizobium lemnae]
MEISGNSTASAGWPSSTDAANTDSTAGTGKISPDGKAFTSMLINGLLENEDLQKKIFDPLNEAIEEGKGE